MHERVIFDVTTAGYHDWWIPCLFVGVTGALAAMMLAGRRRSPRYAAAMPVGAIVTFAAIMLFGAFTWFIDGYRDYRRMRSELLSGHYETVDGVITNFVPGGFGDHPLESFTVAGHDYWYSFSILTPGYHRPHWLGGPLRDGLHVRIADVHGQIARLEVLEQ
ncbi:MAG TPA: hypothetical protein VF041_20430 [Gemmatimonadaceae bacterium]